MAEQIRVNDQGGAAHTHRDQLVADADVEATIQPDPSAVAIPDDPEAARAEIEVTRARMSETIDEIEDALLRKKERLQDKLDVFGPARERPLPAVGIALGAGVLVGLLTGGDDDRDYDDRDYDGRGGYRLAAYRDERVRDAEERAEMWESRARRLLRIAQEQEDELEQLGGGSRGGSRGWEHEGDARESEGGGSALDKLREHLLGMVTGYVSTAVHEMTSSRIREFTR